MMQCRRPARVRSAQRGLCQGRRYGSGTELKEGWLRCEVAGAKTAALVLASLFAGAALLPIFAATGQQILWRGVIAAASTALGSAARGGGARRGVTT